MTLRETPPTHWLIAEVRGGRVVSRHAEQGDSLRLAERLRDEDPEAQVETLEPEAAAARLLELGAAPGDAAGFVIVFRSARLDRATVERHMGVDE